MGVVYAAVALVLVWSPASVTDWVTLTNISCTVVSGPPLFTDTYVIGIHFGFSEESSEIVVARETAIAFVFSISRTSGTEDWAVSSVELTVFITPVVVTFTVLVIFVSVSMLNAFITATGQWCSAAIGATFGVTVGLIVDRAVSA
jgi:hypothetical protein